MTHSPFPGMDPYLEPHWLDVHSKLVTYAADELNARLPNDLLASTEERVAVESDEDDERRVYGTDVRIVAPAAGATAVVEAPAGTAAVAAPYRLLAQVEPITERFIRIVNAGTERLVSVIEFVSPTNKRGPAGIWAFRSKRAALLESGVNFVEVDLVRAGDWQALLRPHQPEPVVSTPYRAAVRVPPDPASVFFFPIGIRDRLPSIPIPLRAKDPEVRLDLQPLLDRAYANGRYARRLSYVGSPVPPLAPEDAGWVEQLLRQAGRR